jgi:ABC-2 type transport system permease protein
MKNYFNGTLRLTRFILRKDYLSTIIWLVILVGMTVAVGFAFWGLFSTPEELELFSIFFTNPAMIAMLGQVFGELSTQTLFVASMLLYTGMALGMMNIFLVVRNTRGEEEKGRNEVIRSLPVGRLASLSAVMIFAFIVNLVISLLIGFGLFAAGYDLSSSLLYGFAIGIIGLFFAAVAALFSQIFSDAKTAMGISMAIVGILYILRGIGDIAFEPLSYISPLGLMLYTESFAGNVWWPIFVIMAISVSIAAVAFYLNTRRDEGRGLVSARPGKPYGGKLMKSPEGLLLRLLGIGMIVWFVSLLAGGISYGAVMGEMEEFITGIEFFEILFGDIPEGRKAEAFIGMVTSVMVILATIPAISAILKLAGEEKAHRYDNLLSKSVSRTRLMGAHLIYAFALSFVMSFAAMFGMWVATTIVTTDLSISFMSMFNSFMIYLPAIWIMIGIAALLCGVFPKRANQIAFGYLGLSFYVIYLVPLLQMPTWVKYFSPFGYMPDLLRESVNWWTMAALVAVAIALTAVGFITYRRRDLL